MGTRHRPIQRHRRTRWPSTTCDSATIHVLQTTTDIDRRHIVHALSLIRSSPWHDMTSGLRVGQKPIGFRLLKVVKNRCRPKCFVVVHRETKFISYFNRDMWVLGRHVIYWRTSSLSKAHETRESISSSCSQNWLSFSISSHCYAIFFMCASQPKIAKRSFKVIDVDTIKRRVTSAGYVKQHVCVYPQAFSRYTSSHRPSGKITTFGGTLFWRPRSPPSLNLGGRNLQQ